MTIDAGQADLSAYVLTALDDHLAAMQRIRDRMRVGSTTAVGARRALALDSIMAAEAYAATLNRVLAVSSGTGGAEAAAPVFVA